MTQRWTRVPGIPNELDFRNQGVSPLFPDQSRSGTQKIVPGKTEGTLTEKNTKHSNVSFHVERPR